MLLLVLLLLLLLLLFNLIMNLRPGFDISRDLYDV
jgi:hypothetical protein